MPELTQGPGGVQPSSKSKKHYALAYDPLLKGWGVRITDADRPLPFYVVVALRSQADAFIQRCQALDQQAGIATPVGPQEAVTQ